MRALLPVLVVSLLLSSGCVERKMQIRSDPPGAEVYLDGTYAGLTPLELPFAHYGTHDVLFRHPGVETPGGRLDYESKLVRFWLRPPGYQWTPLDFFVEHFWPFTLRDTHTLAIPLDVLSERDDATIAQVRANAEAFRERTDQLQREDPEGHVNPEPDTRPLPPLYDRDGLVEDEAEDEGEGEDSE